MDVPLGVPLPLLPLHVHDVVLVAVPGPRVLERNALEVRPLLRVLVVGVLVLVGGRDRALHLLRPHLIARLLLLNCGCAAPFVEVERGHAQRQVRLRLVLGSGHTQPVRVCPLPGRGTALVTRRGRVLPLNALRPHVHPHVHPRVHLLVRKLVARGPVGVALLLINEVRHPDRDVLLADAVRLGPTVTVVFALIILSILLFQGIFLAATATLLHFLVFLILLV